MNLNDQIDWSDTDRIVSNDTRYVSFNGERQTTIAYDSFGRIATMQVSTPEEENHHSTTTTFNYNSFGSYYFGSDLFGNTATGGLANLETYATLSQTAANGEEAKILSRPRLTKSTSRSRPRPSPTPTTATRR